MLKLFIIALGGALGSVSRYGLTAFISSFSRNALFPYGVCLVNILGCFLIGFTMSIIEQRQILSPEIKLFLVVGFLGGFTTFSAFSFDSFHLIRQNQLFIMLLNILLQTGIGILAVGLGYQLSSQVLK